MSEWKLSKSSRKLWCCEVKLSVQWKKISKITLITSNSRTVNCVKWNRECLKKLTTKENTSSSLFNTEFFSLAIVDGIIPSNNSIFIFKFSIFPPFSCWCFVGNLCLLLFCFRSHKNLTRIHRHDNFYIIYAGKDWQIFRLFTNFVEVFPLGFAVFPILRRMSLFSWMILFIHVIAIDKLITISDIWFFFLHFKSRKLELLEDKRVGE